MKMRKRDGRWQGKGNHRGKGDGLTADYLCSLCKSMLCQMQMVIEAMGGATK